MTEFKSLDNWLPVNPTSEDFRSPPIDFIIADLPTREELRKKHKQKYNHIHYIKHQDKHIERTKKYRENNLEKVKFCSIQYYEKNKKSINELDRKRHRNKRKIVINHYSNNENKCACCGVTNNLTIDHINGNGNKHRKEIGYGKYIINWLIKNNFPEGYQVLCFECNTSKHKNHQCRIHNKVLSTQVSINERAT